MNIGRRMVIGFACLITFFCVLGGIRFFQISELDKQYKDLANVDSIAMEIMNNLKFEMDYALTVDIEGATATDEENSWAMEGISASSEHQTASIEEIIPTENTLGNLAEDLKTTLLTFGGDDGAKKEKSEGRVSKLSALIKRRGIE